MIIPFSAQAIIFKSEIFAFTGDPFKSKHISNLYILIEIKNILMVCFYQCL